MQGMTLAAVSASEKGTLMLDSRQNHDKATGEKCRSKALLGHSTSG